MILRLAIAILFTLLLGSPVQAGSDDGGRFSKLLSLLSPDSHMVVLMDLSKLAQDYNAAREWVLHTPAVESSPATKAQLQEQLKQLDDELAKIKEEYSLDISRDLHLMAIGVKFVEQGEPGLVMVLQGKFPEKVPAKIAELASAQTIEGHQVYLDVDDHSMITLMGDLLVMADQASMPIILKNTDAASAILKAHPGLKAGLSGGETMRMDLSFGDFAKKLAQESDMRIISTILRTLSRVQMTAGKGFTLSADFDDAKGAQRGEYLMKGLREIMLSGSHMYRAYGKFLLGFDLDKIQDFPPFAKEALKNRKAVAETLDEIFPPVKYRPSVVRRANTVEISGSRDMAQGSMFILGIGWFGIGSFVAIPLFIQYLNRSRQASNEMAFADVGAALDMFRLDKMRYPTAEEGLDILVKKGLLKEIPKDSYHNPLLYEPKGKEGYVLKTLGADGKPGGVGSDADVVVNSN